MNINQHYISQCLIRRFAKPNGTIESYNIKYGKWKTTGPGGIFSELGYNQLLAFGDFNNDLDDRLKTLEDTLPETLKAIDDAATRDESKLDSNIYEHLCWYCSFLWEMSPAQKAMAPVTFIAQTTLDFQHGKSTLLKAIGMTDDSIAALQRLVTNGSKLRITGKNYQQLVYRLQFAQTIKYTYLQFRHSTKWTIYRSPIELPLGDMALIKYHQPKPNVMMTVLPLSPALVLIGICPMTEVKNTNETTLYGREMVNAEAEYIRGVICLSALFAIAAPTRFGDIKAIRNDAAKTTQFAEIVDLDSALAAGQTPIMSEMDFLISPTTTEEYVKFVHSVVKPPSLQVPVTVA